MVPAEYVEGLYSCLDYYRNVSDPFSMELLNQYDKLFPGKAKFTAGSACTGLYRGQCVCRPRYRPEHALPAVNLAKPSSPRAVRVQACTAVCGSGRLQ